MSYPDSEFSEFETYARPRHSRRRPRRRMGDPLDELLDDTERPRPPAREPSPGISAVLSVVVPGLGQLYCGRLLAGALWFLGTTASYALFFVPGFLVHAFCIWSAYSSAVRWKRW